VNFCTQCGQPVRLGMPFRTSCGALTRPPSGRWAASLTFNSHQEPSTSPTHTACTSWAITLYLRPSGTSYHIGRPPGQYRSSYQPCQ
jgi:hypothetical protein